MKIFKVILIFVILLLISCTSTEKINVVHKATGAIDTNCYLIYGEESKEAAIIDVGGQIDTLLNIIEKKDLSLKYFLFTHSHFDHIIEFPNIRDKYPEAKVVMHKLDYRDIFTHKEWAEKNLGDDFINSLLSDPELKKIFDFDPNSFKEPDIYIEENQLLKLGNLNITLIYSPGHSPGSICYHIDNILFSGDVLFYRSVGRTDVQNSNKEDQIKSVRRLYKELSDSTKVYPGHGRFTNIGSEKYQNKKITINEVYY
ncbi:MBL fold metallo-hydrolase [Bacteroidota bacterium]